MYDEGNTMDEFGRMKNIKGGSDLPGMVSFVADLVKQFTVRVAKRRPSSGQVYIVKKISLCTQSCIFCATQVYDMLVSFMQD